MKKRLAVIAGIFICVQVNAQVAGPVIDIAHILETIYNGYQVYQQVQNTIQQLTYQYEQVKAQIEMLATFDYSSIDSFTEAVSFVDKNLSFVRNTENSLKNMRITVGNTSYDLLSMYKVPGGVLNEMADLFSRQMTPDEKARAWSHYGLNPVNYFYVQTWKNRMEDVSKKISVLEEKAEEQMKENGTVVEQIVAGVRNSTSVVGVLQASVEMNKKLFDELQMLNYSTRLTGDLISSKIMEDVFMPNRLQISSDFFEKSDVSEFKLQLKGDEQ